MSIDHPPSNPTTPTLPPLQPGYDVVVVGAGIAGLTAAAYAGRAGLRVLVVDGHAPGGRARTSSVDAAGGRGRFSLNQGAHALYLAGELRAVLDDLGVRFHGGAPGGLELWKDDARHVFPSGPTTLLRTTALGRRGKAAMVKLLARLPSMKPAALEGRTVDDWLAATGLPADADALTRCLVRTATYAHAPDVIDAGAVVKQLQRALKGVTYLDDGWQSIVDGLRAAATAAGATIVDHAAARTVRRHGDGWEVELAGDRSVRTVTAILAAGGPAAAGRLLTVEPGRFGPTGPAVRVAGLDIGLDHAAPSGGLFSADEPLYLSRHMPPARLGPEGTDLLSAVRYLAPGEQPGAADLRAELWRHAGRLGIHDGGPGVIMSRYLHDLVVAHGMPLASEGGLRGRPPVAVAGHPGVLLAGDWVGPVGLLADASAASGRAAALLAASMTGAPVAERVPA